MRMRKSSADGKRFGNVNTDFEIITDADTGCKYIYVDEGAGQNRVVAISPLMKNSVDVDCGQE